MDSDEGNRSPTAAEQLYHELHVVVSRYSKESDVTVFETVGALEAVKLDMMDELKRWNESPKDDV